MITAEQAEPARPYRRVGIQEVMIETYFERHPWPLDTWMRRWTDPKTREISADLDGREVWLRRRAVRDPTLVPFWMRVRVRDLDGKPMESSDLVLLPAETQLDPLARPPAYPAARRSCRLGNSKEADPCPSTTTNAVPAETSGNTTSQLPNAIARPRFSATALAKAVEAR